MKKEIWKPVTGWEKLYHVSNLGRVKRLERPILYPNGFTYTKKEKIIALSNNGNNYFTVLLTKTVNGKHQQKRFLIHRLVAKEFCKNPENKKFVNHLDGDKKNNKANNLEWCHHYENLNHARENLNFQKSLEKINKQKKLNEFDVLYIRDFHRRKILTVKELANLFQLNSTNSIRDVLKYKNYKYLP